MGVGLMQGKASPFTKRPRDLLSMPILLWISTSPGHCLGPVRLWGTRSRLRFRSSELLCSLHRQVSAVVVYNDNDEESDIFNLFYRLPAYL